MRNGSVHALNYFHDMVADGELDGLDYIPTMPEFLNFLVWRYAEFPALGQGETTYTYAELVSRVARRAAYLNDLGLRKGAHIGVLAPNDLDAMEWFLAIPAAGFTVMMLPASLGEAQAAGLTRKYDLAALFAAPACAAASTSAGCPVYPSAAIGKSEAAFVETTREMPAAIFLTGGTSGMPKGAVLSHGALMRGAFNGVYGPGHILRQRYLTLLPLSHVFGSIRGLLACLYTGSVVYACPDLKAGLMQLPVLRPTVLVLVPGMIDLILGIAKLKGKGFLGDLNVIIAGAAPVSPRLMKECAGYGIRVCAGYGLTECANLTAGNADTDVLPEAVGPAYPEQEVKIENGELLIKGDNVMLCYYGEPELTAQVLTDGWFHTGDLARFKEFHGERFIVITGRAKNIILLPNGENVSPEEIESLFYKDPLVKDCLVSTMTVNGNEVIGVEILPYAPALGFCTPEETQVRLQAVVDTVNEQLPSQKRVMKLVVRTEDFKRSGAMKILRDQN